MLLNDTEFRRAERGYKSWIAFLGIAVLLLAFLCVGLFVLLLLQTQKIEKIESHGSDALIRKPRSIWKMVDEIVEEMKMEFLANDTCIIKTKDEEERAKPVCITKHCTETASCLISAMDESVDPCKDFYQFACGGYIKKNPVPADEVSVSSMHTYYKFYQLILRNILEDTDYTKEPPIIFKMQEAYHVCINTTYQAEKEAEGFKRFVQKELNGWPGTIKDVKEESKEEFLGNLVRRGFDVPFIKLSLTDGSLVDPTKFYLQIGSNMKPVPGVDKPKVKVGLTCKIRSKMNYLERVGQALGHNDTCFRNAEEIETISNFQIFMFLINLFQGDTDGMMTTIGELNAETGAIFDWLKFINAAVSGIKTFTEDDKINVKSVAYLISFMEFINATDIGALSRFTYDSIVAENLLNGGPNIDKYFIEYMIHKDSDFKMPPREEVCLDWIVERYTMPLTSLVVKHYLNPRTKKEATLMVDLLINAYENTIRKSSWLDKKTKEKAITKARSMRKQIAYPEFVLKDKELEKLHSKIPEVFSTHIENVIALQKVYRDEEFEALLRSFEPHSDWLATPLTINAGYSPNMNTIVLQLGMLYLPFFDVDRIAAVNYGMLGSIIGHEIGHGFDTDGRLYDEIGLKTNWWTKETEKKYLKLTQCFIDQYSSFCPEELSADEACVDGERTVGENIADNSGLKAAHESYKEYVEKYGAEKRLPGLQEYSPEQVFFISFAYAWCENIPIFNWKSRYAADVHSPGKYRVLGALSNSKEFAEAFNCPPGPMNRDKDRCTLW